MKFYCNEKIPKLDWIFHNYASFPVAGGGLAVTPDVVKNYYASLEMHHNDIKANVTGILKQCKEVCN